MLDDWDERAEVVAAGSICPVPDCGALAISYGPPGRTGRDNARSWCEFTCPRCGLDFTVPEDELSFSVSAEGMAIGESASRIARHWSEQRHTAKKTTSTQ
jgi:hypothetical protein